MGRSSTKNGIKHVAVHRKPRKRRRAVVQDCIPTLHSTVFRDGLEKTKISDGYQVRTVKASFSRLPSEIQDMIISYMVEDQGVAASIGQLRINKQFHYSIHFHLLRSELWNCDMGKLYALDNLRAVFHTRTMTPCRGKWPMDMPNLVKTMAKELSKSRHLPLPMSDITQERLVGEIVDVIVSHWPCPWKWIFLGSVDERVLRHPQHLVFLHAIVKNDLAAMSFFIERGVVVNDSFDEIPNALSIAADMDCKTAIYMETPIYPRLEFVIQKFTLATQEDVSQVCYAICKALEFRCFEVADRLMNWIIASSIEPTTSACRTIFMLAERLNQMDFLVKSLDRLKQYETCGQALVTTIEYAAEEWRLEHVKILLPILDLNFDGTLAELAYPYVFQLCINRGDDELAMGILRRFSSQNLGAECQGVVLRSLEAGVKPSPRLFAACIEHGLIDTMTEYKHSHCWQSHYLIEKCVLPSLEPLLQVVLEKMRVIEPRRLVDRVMYKAVRDRKSPKLARLLWSYTTDPPNNDDPPKFWMAHL